MRAIIIALALSSMIYLGAAACASTVTNCASCADSQVTWATGLSYVAPTAAALNTICTACNTMFYLPAPGACTQCPSNCVVCSSASTCTTCSSGYFAVSGYCQSCSNTTAYASGTTAVGLAGCLTCTATSTAVTCTSCNPASGYQPALLTGTTTCTACTVTVGTTATAASGCTACATVGGTAGSTQCLSCSSTTSVASTGTGGCVTTGAVSNCLVLASSGCAQCNTGYVVASAACTTTGLISNCLLHASATICQICSSGYGPSYASSGNGAACWGCATVTSGQTYTAISNCVSCTFSSATAITCTQCASGYTLNTAGTSCTAATTLTCTSPCATCTGTATTCTSCVSGSILLANGTCITGSPATNCWVYSPAGNCILCAQAGYTPSATASYFLASVGNCTSCPSNCNTCSSNTTCSAGGCATGFNLSSNGSCYNASAAANANKSSGILMPGLALLSMIFYYLF